MLNSHMLTVWRCCKYCGCGVEVQWYDRESPATGYREGYRAECGECGTNGPVVPKERIAWYTADMFSDACESGEPEAPAQTRLELMLVENQAFRIAEDLENRGGGYESWAPFSDGWMEAYQRFVAECDQKIRGLLGPWAEVVPKYLRE